MAWDAPGTTAVKIGLHVPNFGAFADPGTVTPLARRRPWNVVRQVVTLDHLSHGRVTLGIGLGVSAGPEFRSFGVLPWSRPVEESARTVESGPPGR